MYNFDLNRKVVRYRHNNNKITDSAKLEALIDRYIQNYTFNFMNNSTATSFAAFKIAGAAPPSHKACCANAKLGKRRVSTDVNVSCSIAARSRRSDAQCKRSGHAKA